MGRKSLYKWATLTKFKRCLEYNQSCARDNEKVLRGRRQPQETARTVLERGTVFRNFLSNL